MEHSYLVKLVRDRVGNSHPKASVEYRPIPDDGDAVGLLRAKLIEEAVEYVLNPSPEELADVFDVAYALAHHDLGVGATYVAEIRRDKERERGGFDELTGMYATVNASGA